VKSLNQATILAETSGEITRLYRSIGAHVSAGETIGEFENSSQQAAVVQAEGALESAQAALAKAEGTTAANSGISSAQAATAAQNAATSLSASLTSAYSALDDALHAKADTLFDNPRSAAPHLLGFTIPDSQLVNTIQSARLGLEATVSDAKSAASADSSVSLDGRADAMLADAKTIRGFLDSLIAALNEAVPNTNFSASTIATYQTTLATARTEVNSAVTALTAAKSSYDSAEASAQSAENSATTGTQSDIAASQASVKSAQGSLDAARAALGKTIIRSPISGTIVSMPVTQGDFVSAYSQVAEVSNPGALYVDTEVTADDAKTLASGDSATINGNITGIITFVAPALDPATGKIEVKIGLKGDLSALTDGEAVTLSLTRSSAPKTASSPSQITIPIVAAKITPAGPVVFTVSASSTLEAHPITLGAILGDQVVVASGVTSDLEIVTDARGLSAGQTVAVNGNK
jgi:RND family efflux transporter MFP subunit